MFVQMAINLETHPKTRRLAAELDVSRNEAIGILFRLWSVAVRHAEDGDLASWTPDLLDEDLGYAGATEALVCVGFLERDGHALRVHDWKEGTGGGLWKRYQARERKRKQRSKSVTVTEGGHGDVTHEREREQEQEQEREHEPPTPPDGGSPRGQTPTGERPKTKSKASPDPFSGLTVEDLAAQPKANPAYEGETWGQYWRGRFPMLDGNAGRMMLREALQAALDWNRDQSPKKRKRAHSFFTNWLAKEAKGASYAWQRDLCPSPDARDIQRDRALDRREKEAQRARAEAEREKRRAAHAGGGSGPERPAQRRSGPPPIPRFETAAEAFQWVKRNQRDIPGYEACNTFQEFSTLWEKNHDAERAASVG